jgi:hypothetical protein
MSIHTDGAMSGEPDDLPSSRLYVYPPAQVLTGDRTNDVLLVHAPHERSD